MALLPSFPVTPFLAAYTTHLIVRWVHVLAMATLFGGALLVWGLLRRDDTRDEPTTVVRIAATYEWLFWAGAGLLVLTGVGNLGTMAPAIPGPGTTWGMNFSTKLLGALVLLVGSLVRTFGVVRLLAGDHSDRSGSAVDRLRDGYGATALVLLVIVALAEVLAHG